MFAVKTWSSQAIKCVSDSLEECEQYQLTSVVESDRSSNGLDREDGLALSGRRKRMKKALPKDFTSSQDLDLIRKFVFS